MKLNKMMVRIWNKARGTRCKFSDNTVYETHPETGQVRRLHPIKSWASKAERKQVLRARRAMRGVGQVNSAVAI